MKIYIVENFSYVGYKRYGVFSSIESAKIKLSELFNKEKQYYDQMNEDDDLYIYDVKYINEKKFSIFSKFKDEKENSEEDFVITEEVVK